MSGWLLKKTITTNTVSRNVSFKRIELIKKANQYQMWKKVQLCAFKERK